MSVKIDSPKLRELSRTQLQTLAKREVVRAVGKTEDIIRRLIQKHPRGVPVTEDDSPSISSAPPKQTVSKGSPLSPVPETFRSQADSKGKGKQLAEVPSPSPSSSSEALEQLLYPEDDYVAGPSNTDPTSASTPQPEFQLRPDDPVPPVLPPTHAAHNGDGDARGGAPPYEASNPGWKTEDEDESDDGYDYPDYPKGAPNHYMLLDTLRQSTTLVNNIPPMETCIGECQCLLRRTETLLGKATPDARELAVTREYLETFLLGKMKQKRELWDGTGRMEKETRKIRMEWLRAERRTESEKKWRETKEMYEKKGLEPEPLSAFILESDEEIIESLQTTPMSNGSESSKRPREQHVSSGDTDSEGEGRRKRERR